MQDDVGVDDQEVIRFRAEFRVFWLAFRIQFASTPAAVQVSGSQHCLPPHSPSTVVAAESVLDIISYIMLLDDSVDLSTRSLFHESLQVQHSCYGMSKNRLPNRDHIASSPSPNRCECNLTFASSHHSLAHPAESRPQQR